MELVSVVISGDNVQQKDVLGLGVQTGNSELHLRKHLPRPPINTYSSIRSLARLSELTYDYHATRSILSQTRVVRV